MDEQELLLRLRDGDERAFTEIFNNYSPLLTGHLLRLLKSRELVEEVLQDTFMSLWEYRQRIEPDKPIKAYLFGIAANNARNLFRRAAHDGKMRAYFYPAISEGYEHIESRLFQQENHQLLHDLLDKLPSRQREVYTLCKLEGLSYKEVSERLNISESTVNSHILRANAFLKNQFMGKPDIITWLLLPAFVAYMR